MLTRVITAAVLIVVAVTLIALQGWPLRIALTLVMLTSMYEVYGAFEHRGAKPVKWVGYLYCVIAALAQVFYLQLHHMVFSLISPTLLSLVVCSVLGMIVIILRGKPDFDSMAATLFPMIYPGMFYVLILPLQDLSGTAISNIALILTFFISNVSDAFALLVGVRFGKRKLSPQISPHKTVEGAVAGLVSAIAFTILVPICAKLFCAAIPLYASRPLQIPSLWLFALLGLVAGVLSQFGDLVASLIKRYCGIKDYGSIFPGHGGVMDRMDGVLFCGVACYTFFRLTGL